MFPAILYGLLLIHFVGAAQMGPERFAPLLALFPSFGSQHRAAKDRAGGTASSTT